MKLIATERFIPRFVSKDELPKLEIPENDTVLVTLGHNPGSLSKQPPRLGLAKSSSCTYVTVHVPMVTLKQ